MEKEWGRETEKRNDQTGDGGEGGLERKCRKNRDRGGFDSANRQSEACL